MYRIVMLVDRAIAVNLYYVTQLYNASTEETISIFHSQFCLILCASFKERKNFTGSQADKPWLKTY